MSETKSIVVLSGGQDSATCFFKALKETEVVGAIFYRYGQQHELPEFQCVYGLTERYSVPLQLVDVPELGILSQSALLQEDGDVNQPHSWNPLLPASFVPGRNLLFLTLAAIYAMKEGATQIWTGVCQTDYSGYPDCRQSTIVALENALRLGLDFRGLEIVTPLMYLTKAETFKMAAELKCLAWIINETHTGYTGDRSHLYEWGWGPPEGTELDPASALRAKGWNEFKSNYPQLAGVEE